MNGEFKHDIYGRRQTAKIASDFLFLIFLQSLNKSHKNRKMSSTIHRKYKYFHSIVQTAEDRRQKFHFCRLPFDVSLCLLGLRTVILDGEAIF